MNPTLLLIASWVGRSMETWLRSLRRPLAGEVAALRERNERLRAENELLRARLLRLDPYTRPRYKPWERLAVLWHRARYGLSEQATARAFVVSGQTIRNWLEEVERGTSRLVRARRPLNTLPDLVAEVASRLRREWPRWGTRRIAGILARLGLKASRTSVQRLLRRPPPRGRPLSSSASRSTLQATRPNRVWLIDFTKLRSLLKSVAVMAVMDLHSRKILSVRVCEREPDAAEACAAVQYAIRMHGRPRWMITDCGTQFTSRRFRSFLARRKIRRRYGAVGRPNSIAVIERGWRTFKEEFGRGLFLWLPLRTLGRKVASYVRWYNGERPHTSLRFQTPDEVHSGRRPPRPRRLERARLEVRLIDGERGLPVFRLRAA